MDSEELHLQVLRLLDQNPNLSQRQIARELGLSVGKTNYAVRAVISRGWVKAQNFSNAPDKRRYLYRLTPAGVSEKAQLAYRHLQRKRAEHEQLMAEIEALRAEVEAAEPGGEPAADEVRDEPEDPAAPSTPPTP
ncbi:MULTISPECIES: MarR family EPS-associated transcriptional regulator [unclassified Halorhodospira]|uniref:MarR family EPS-associated transcriptional regulator n=1 Tax=unclassified Halorhodospira TaxID=2626748 RepID=UPI001EE84FE1|nr:MULTISPECIES: MarR family EPS-associated transcriptional regulator [unclassified Halorhodospira]MCG5541974.1 MarR family EPS-associated transcriptional regulator [Halorhodospira sp. M39old]MCG5547034.1 MarR family EPS-associated transcriptional regulator [Halorhodospira sp. M38]